MKQQLTVTHRGTDKMATLRVHPSAGHSAKVMAIMLGSPRVMALVPDLFQKRMKR